MAAVLILAAAVASADDFTARGQVSYQSIKTDNLLTSGLRQQYDLGLSKALTYTSLVRLYCRADDFQGTTNFAAGAPQDARTRQIEPAGEFMMSTLTMRAHARSDYFIVSSQNGPGTSKLTIARTTGMFEWAPDRLPRLQLIGQRNATHDDASTVNLTEQFAAALMSYEWREFHGSVRAQSSSTVDPTNAFDRRSAVQQAELGYATTRWDGRFTASADAGAQRLSLDERATGGGSASVPTPVTISRTLYAVDDTPLNSSDRAPAINALLNDNDLTTSSGISLGRDAASFQNFVIDLNRVDRMDEVRVIVRDEVGNPLQHGGGPVEFDAYTSQDGVVWTLLAPAETTFNAPLSYYSVTFPQTSGRWFKIVNFGVNADPTFVTELQAYYHTTIAAGANRKGDQSLYSGTTNLSFHPLRRLTMSYTGLYSSTRQALGGLPTTSTNDLEHLATLQLDLPRDFSVRSQIEKRDARAETGRLNSADGLTFFIDYKPTRQLTSTIELGRQNETLDGSAFVLQTVALHNSMQILRSVLVTLDIGTQRQQISTDDSTATRHFAALTGLIQLAPAWRLLVNGSFQRSTSQSSDPAVQLLGAAKDERITGEVVWRPGRPLQVSARYGYVSGVALSGFIQRYHVEWFPFGDGTVSLGGSLDEDIDPMLDRRATRALFTPRWTINRWSAVDLNYTSVRSTLGTFTSRDRTLYATLTLTR